MSSQGHNLLPHEARLRQYGTLPQVVWQRVLLRVPARGPQASRAQGEPGEVQGQPGQVPHLHRCRCQGHRYLWAAVQ